MNLSIVAGKGGWNVNFEGEKDFHVFRGDEALRLMKLVCSRGLNVNIDDIVRLRTEEIAATRAIVDKQ